MDGISCVPNWALLLGDVVVITALVMLVLLAAAFLVLACDLAFDRPRQARGVVDPTPAALPARRLGR